MKPRLLWVGDAVVATGFAKVTHHVLEALRHRWDVYVLGINYLGDPHSYPYPVYPCWPGGDMFGVGRVKQLVDHIKPNLVVLLNDPWNINEYVEKCEQTNVVAVMPVDGKNCRGEALNRLSHAIFWTQFGAEEARRGGYKGSFDVIPLGVDLRMYRPYDQLEVRRKVIGLPEELDNAFIVGNVNRNQPRKRLDLTVAFFAEWVNRYRRDNAYLYMHICPTGDHGYDIKQLMKYYGFGPEQKRLILCQPDIGYGVDENELAKVYSAFDVQITTTQGEGWGLTTMEGMACGVPQIVPDWAALGEWTGDCVYRVPCDNICVTPDRINVIGATPDKRNFIQALEDVYQDRTTREYLAKSGQSLVSRTQFDWRAIGQRYVEVLERFQYDTEEMASNA